MVASDGTVPRFCTHHLADGSVVHCRIDRTVPVVALTAAVRGGAAGETVADAGLGAMTCQAALKGAGGLTAERFHETVEDEAASLSPIADRDFGGVFMSALAGRLDPALDMLALAVREPDFADQEIEQEKRLAREQLAAVADNPFQFASLRMRAMLYGDQPYGRPLVGSAESIAAITRDHVVARHRRDWTSGNVQFVVSGDFDRDKLLDRLESMVAGLPMAADDGYSGAGVARHLTDIESDRIVREQNQAVVLVGWPGPLSDSEDRVALMLLKEVLNGQSGRLFEKLRNRRSLCYNTGVMSSSGFGQGMFLGYVLTAPESADQARSALLEELVQLTTDTVPDAELERAQAKLAGSILIGGQANATRVSLAQRDVMYGRDADDLLQLVEKVRAGTAQDLRDAARRYLHPDRRCDVAVGPA